MKHRLVIEFPLPPRELSANPKSPGAWRRKSEATKKYRYYCGNCALLAKREAFRQERFFFPSLKPVVLHLHFYYGPTPLNPNTYRARDCANAIISFKAGQDALVDAGILFNDSAKYLKMGETVLFTKASEHKGRACVEAILEWEDEE